MEIANRENIHEFYIEYRRADLSQVDYKCRICSHKVITLTDDLRKTPDVNLYIAHKINALMNHINQNHNRPRIMKNCQVKIGDTIITEDTTVVYDEISIPDPPFWTTARAGQIARIVTFIACLALSLWIGWSVIRLGKMP